MSTENSQLLNQIKILKKALEFYTEFDNLDRTGLAVDLSPVDIDELIDGKYRGYGYTAKKALKEVEELEGNK